MKRDMGLIREILLAMEESNEPQGWVPLDGIPGYSDSQKSYHVYLLADAGLIEATDCSSMDGDNWKPLRLNWYGHEFLEAARNNTIWDKALSQFKEKGVGLSFDLVKALLIDLAKKELIG